MTTRKAKKGVCPAEVKVAAFRNAWRFRCCFTVTSFCAKFGFKDTRQLRAVLREMVANGDLFSFRESDRKNAPIFYCAQQTEMASIFQQELTK